MACPDLRDGLCSWAYATYMGKASADRTAGDHMTATWADRFTHCQGCVPWIGSRTSTTMIGRTVLLTGGIRRLLRRHSPAGCPYMETVIDQQTGEEYQVKGYITFRILHLK